MLTCASDTGLQQGLSLPDIQAAYSCAGMQQALKDTRCCFGLQASLQRCCVSQIPSLRPGVRQGLRQRSCPTARMPRIWQPSSCPWTAACRAWCSPLCSCRGGMVVPSRWESSRQSESGAGEQERIRWPARNLQGIPSCCTPCTSRHTATCWPHQGTHPAARQHHAAVSSASDSPGRIGGLACSVMCCATCCSPHHRLGLLSHSGRQAETAVCSQRPQGTTALGAANTCVHAARQAEMHVLAWPAAGGSPPGAGAGWGRPEGPVLVVRLLPE